jgi:four helix bundle protein
VRSEKLGVRSEKCDTVENKSKKFAIRIVKLYQYLCDNKKEFVLSKQLLRSGTSIGANIAEAECAISKKDFNNKMYISFKECAESIYWLELLKETDYITSQEYDSMFSDCNELKKMLSAITKKTTENLTKE